MLVKMSKRNQNSLTDRKSHPEARKSSRIDRLTLDRLAKLGKTTKVDSSMFSVKALLEKALFGRKMDQFPSAL